ncbi:MAG: sensor histidine kinase [Candidatus Limnocylindrales bacterium]
MFARARRRLAIRYLALFAIVIVSFSVVFLLVLVLVLRPAFDIAPEIDSAAAAQEAYSRTIERIAIALLLANGTVIALIGAGGYYLAGRTLRPIQDAHDRQRRFVADASHEMRTPLAVIRSTAESALTPGASSEAAPLALTEIIGATEELGRLTADLLLLARSESGVIEPHREAVDLSVLVAEECERSRAADPIRGPAIRLALTGDLLVAVDATEVSRVLANVLDNALRYGEGAIDVVTSARDGIAAVEIGDGGPGIAAADLDRIFEPFFRVRSDAGAPGGSGLGLAIARALVERQGGRLTVRSRPGDGSVFRLEFPSFR